jgi:hypothetical protein
LILTLIALTICITGLATSAGFIATSVCTSVRSWRAVHYTLYTDLKKATLLVPSLGNATVLVEQTEYTLLSLVASAGKKLQSLATGSLLAPANNAAMLVLNEVRLGEAAGRLLGRTVEYLSLGTGIHRKIGHLISYTLFCFWPQAKKQKLNAKLVNFNW